MPVNEDLFDHSTRHHIRVQRYGASAKNDFQRILDDSHAQVRDSVASSGEVVDSQNTDSKAYLALLALLLSLLEDMRAALQDALETALVAFAANEAANELSLLSGIANLALNQPSADDIASVVTDVAFQGRYLNQWVDDFVKSDFSRIQAGIVGGMQRGDSAIAIARDLQDVAFPRAASQLENLSRTLFNGVTNWARLAVMQANADLVGMVQWVAVLDDTTCPICQELDGQIFPLDAVDPPPAHPSCRCFLLGLFGDETRMAMSKKHGKKFARMAAAHRAKFTGKAPRRQRYETWLRAQPADVQNEALGPTRAALFRRGKLHLSRFVTDRRHILTLDELKKRDKTAFKRAGISLK